MAQTTEDFEEISQPIPIATSETESQLDDYPVESDHLPEEQPVFLTETEPETDIETMKNPETIQIAPKAVPEELSPLSDEHEKILSAQETDISEIIQPTQNIENENFETPVAPTRTSIPKRSFRSVRFLSEFLTLTLSAWPFRGHTALKSIL